MINKNKIVNHIEKLNDTKRIKIDGTENERLVFNNEETFKIFGEMDKGCLVPFKDETYEWLNSFLLRVVELLGYEDFDTLEELENKISDDLIYEWIDSEVDPYTSGLTEWLNSHNENVYYLTQALEEQEIKDGFQALQVAQYKAIDEVFNSALRILMENLKEEFEED